MSYTIKQSGNHVVFTRKILGEEMVDVFSSQGNYIIKEKPNGEWAQVFDRDGSAVTLAGNSLLRAVRQYLKKYIERMREVGVMD